MSSVYDERANDIPEYYRQRRRLQFRVPAGQDTIDVALMVDDNAVDVPCKALVTSVHGAFAGDLALPAFGCWSDILIGLVLRLTQWPTPPAHASTSCGGGAAEGIRSLLST